MDEKYDGVKDWDNVLEHYAKLNRYYEDSRNTLASEILADNDKKDARKNKIIFSLVAIIVFFDCWADSFKHLLDLPVEQLRLCIAGW